MTVFRKLPIPRPDPSNQREKDLFNILNEMMQMLDNVLNKNQVEDPYDLRYLKLDASNSMTSSDLISNLNADLLDGQDASDFALVGHTHSATLDIPIPFFSSGDAVLNKMLMEGYIPIVNTTIIKVDLMCTLAPTGADLKVDLTVNGAAQTRISTLAAGSLYQTTDITDIVAVAGQRIGIKFTQVGSTLPGTNVMAVLHGTQSI